MKQEISPMVIRRLPLYLRTVQQLAWSGVTTVSSQELAHRASVNAAQVRKDLAHFGEFGVKGKGYDVPFLLQKLRSILQLDREIRVCIVGAGNLGQALSNYTMYGSSETLRITALFDIDPLRIGQQIQRLSVLPLDQLRETVQSEGVRIGMITVPADQAQSVASLLVQAGIEGIVNFAPTIVRVPAHVRVHHVDFTSELHSLAYYLTCKEGDPV